MKFIIGLGNPESKYIFTRHNAGFLFIDTLMLMYLNNNFNISYFDDYDLDSIVKFTIDKYDKSNKFPCLYKKFDDLVLVKPTTYMNASGVCVRKILDFFKPDWNDTPNFLLENFYLAYDDLDIELSKAKMTYHKTPKKHNGVLSVFKYLKTDKIWSIRIGTDSRTKEVRSVVPGANYVLMPLTTDEKQKMLKGIQNALSLLFLKKVINGQ